MDNFFSEVISSSYSSYSLGVTSNRQLKSKSGLLLAGPPVPVARGNRRLRFCSLFHYLVEFRDIQKAPNVRFFSIKGIVYYKVFSTDKKISITEDSAGTLMNK